MNKLRNNLILKYWKSILVIFVILVLCVLPGDEIDKAKFIDIPHFDKIVHFFMYFALAFVMTMDASFNSNRSKKEKIFGVLIICILTGLIIELLQEFLIPMRSGSIYDMIANIMGTVSGICFYLYFLKR